jgi:hypothetical protein
MSGSFADECREALQIANQEAHRLNHEYIGTEHLLLALLEGCSKADTSVLMHLDVDPVEIRSAIDDVIERGPDLVSGGVLPLTPRARRVLDYATQEARELDHDGVERDHLLLGLLREGEGVAARVLVASGLDLDDVRRKVRWWRIAIDPAWLRWNNGTVTLMAHAISAGRSWGDLPVLADAMQEAGCDDAEVLACLRERPKEARVRAVLNMILRRADPQTLASVAPRKRWWQVWK